MRYYETELRVVVGVEPTARSRDKKYLVKLVQQAIKEMLEDLNEDNFDARVKRISKEEALG